MSPGCWANMTWATAAPFVGACLGDLAGRGACSTACSQQLAPFNQRCFGSVLAETFLQYSDAAQPPSAEQAAAFYAACFPAVPAASAVTSGAAAGQQAGGLAVLAAAAAATALLLAEMSW